jgi:hypothetical protein
MTLQEWLKDYDLEVKIDPTVRYLEDFLIVDRETGRVLYSTESADYDTSDPVEILWSMYLYAQTEPMFELSAYLGRDCWNSFVSIVPS